MNNIKMLYYERIDVSERTNVNKTGASKECDICHYQCILNKGFKFQPDACSGFHDALMKSIILKDIAILNIRGVAYRYIINGISKSDAVNFLQNADLTEQKGV